MTVIEGIKALSEGQELYALWKDRKILIADWQHGKGKPRFISEMPGPVPLSIGQLNSSVGIIRQLPAPAVTMDEAIRKALAGMELTMSCEDCADVKECGETFEGYGQKLCLKGTGAGREVAINRLRKVLEGVSIIRTRARDERPTEIRMR